MTFKKTNRAGQIALTLGVLLGIAFAVFATGSAWAEERTGRVRHARTCSPDVVWPTRDRGRERGCALAERTGTAVRETRRGRG